MKQRCCDYVNNKAKLGANNPAQDRGHLLTQPGHSGAREVRHYEETRALLHVDPTREAQKSAKRRDSPQPSALSPPRSSLCAPPSAFGPRPSALHPPPSALGPQPSALLRARGLPPAAPLWARSYREPSHTRALSQLSRERGPSAASSIAAPPGSTGSPRAAFPPSALRKCAGDPRATTPSDAHQGPEGHGRDPLTQTAARRPARLRGPQSPTPMLAATPLRAPRGPAPTGSTWRSGFLKAFGLQGGIAATPSGLGHAH